MQTTKISTFSILNSQSTKKEHQVSSLDSKGGRCIMVDAKDTAAQWGKVSQVLTVVNEELGYSVEDTDYRNCCAAVFLYILDNKVGEQIY